MNDVRLVHPTHGHLSLQPLTWVSRKPKNAAFSSIEFALALLTFPSSRSLPALADWLLLFTIVSLRSIHGAWSICGGRLACRYRPRGELGGNGPWSLSSRRCLGQCPLLFARESPHGLAFNSGL